MGWIADLLKEVPSAARYKAELEELAAEHASLKQENATLKNALEKANAELATLRLGGDGNLGPEKEKILRLLSERDRLPPQVIASACGMGVELTNFHLEELFESEHVTNVLVMGEGAYYSLDQKGRRYLVTRGLLK
jgi:hypothetical protein